MAATLAERIAQLVHDSMVRAGASCAPLHADEHDPAPLPCAWVADEHQCGRVAASLWVCLTCGNQSALCREHEDEFIREARITVSVTCHRCDTTGPWHATIAQVRLGSAA